MPEKPSPPVDTAGGATVHQLDLFESIVPPRIVRLHYLDCDRRRCGCLPRWQRCPAGAWVRESPRETAS